MNHTHTKEQRGLDEAFPSRYFAPFVVSQIEFYPSLLCKSWCRGISPAFP